jgi:hypothetical protein
LRFIVALPGELQAIGHIVRLMPPIACSPISPKNDAADAEAICAPTAPNMLVQTKTEQ